MDLVLGIDGGGTSCRAALATASGAVLGRGKSGPANIMTDLEGARHNIVEAARLAFVDADRDPALIPQTDAVLGSPAPMSAATSSSFWTFCPSAAASWKAMR